MADLPTKITERELPGDETTIDLRPQAASGTVVPDGVSDANLPSEIKAERAVRRRKMKRKLRAKNASKS